MAARSSDTRLDCYRSRRDFRKSPEPSGSEAACRVRKDRNPIFVIHEHRASSHHFDVRLEVDGVLKSWAVPKGPSTDTRERRLAVLTEDHPLDYADFEGVIPQDEYGGGAVVVWDAGPYRNIKTGDDGETVEMARAVEMGTVEVWLEGKKLRGGYALVRTNMRGDPDNWLLIKMDDEGADARRKPARTQPESVLSGKTLDDLEAQESDD